MHNNEVPLEQPLPGYLLPFIGKRILPDQLSTQNIDPAALIKQQYIKAIPSITKNAFSSTCNRCGNSDRTYMGAIDCSRCNTLHLYCRKCIQMGRVLACAPLYDWIGPDIVYRLQEEICAWSGTLTDVQQRAADRAVQAVEDRTKLLIWGVCGAQGEYISIFTKSSILWKHYRHRHIFEK